MDFQAVDAKLSKKLKELEDRLAHIKKDMSKSHSLDSTEQATERENDEVLEEIGQETEVSIQDIRSALNRISEETYGICAGCGEIINPERLEAIPEAIHCMSCAAA